MRRILLPGDERKFGPDPTNLTPLQYYQEVSKLTEEARKESNEAHDRWSQLTTRKREARTVLQSVCQHQWGPQHDRTVGKSVERHQICTLCDLDEKISRVFPNREAAMRSLRRELRAIKNLIAVTPRIEDKIRLQRRYSELYTEKERIKRMR